MQFIKSCYHHLRTHRTDWLLLTLSLVLLSSVVMVDDIYAWLGSPRGVPQADDEILFPSVFVDELGYVHVVWTESGEPFRDGRVAYNRGRLSDDGESVEWEGGRTLDEATSRATNPSPPRVAVSTDGVVHIIYGDTNGRVRYLRNTSRGARNTTWRLETVYDDGFHNSAIALDAAGIPYASWGRGADGGSDIFFAYRAGAGNWVVKNLNTDARLAREPRIGVSGSGSNAIVHVVYEYQREKDGDFYTGYHRGRRSASQFAKYDFGSQKLGLGRPMDRPFLAVDESTGDVYVTANYRNGDNTYSMIFATSTDDGTTWSKSMQFTSDSQHPDRSSVDAASGIAHYTLTLKKASDSRVSKIGYRSYDASTKKFSGQEDLSSENDGRKDDFSRISVGGRGKAVVWVQDNIERAVYNIDPGGAGPVPTATRTGTPTRTATPTSTPTATPIPRPIGSMSIVGDLDSGKKSSSLNVEVQFSITGGIADQFELSNDQTNWSPFAQLPENLRPTWTLSAGAANAVACEFRTVYGRLKNSQNGLTSGDPPMRASIQLDPGVDADVLVANPVLADNGIALQDFGGADGAYGGDPRYTRTEFYYGRVTANANECSGLSAVEFGEMTPAMNGTASADGIFPLSQFDPQEGPYDISISATDGAGHERIWNNLQIILDRTSPQVQVVSGTTTLTEVLTVLDTDGTPLQEPHDSALVDLRFENLLIDDNLYGSNGERKSFWGVWLANSSTPISPTDKAALDALDWRPVEVTDFTKTGSNQYDFVVNSWNLFAGISDPQPGDTPFYVYARVLDGAGNYSTITINSDGVDLTQDATGPIVYLPAIRR